MHSPVTRHLKTAMITANTFVNQMIVFASRKVIDADWINQKTSFLPHAILIVNLLDNWGTRQFCLASFRRITILLVTGQIIVKQEL